MARTTRGGGGAQRPEVRDADRDVEQGGRESAGAVRVLGSCQARHHEDVADALDEAEQHRRLALSPAEPKSTRPQAGETRTQLK